MQFPATNTAGETEWVEQCGQTPDTSSAGWRMGADTYHFLSHIVDSTIIGVKCFHCFDRKSGPQA